MSRFFRTVRPFIRSISNVTTPLCVSFGVASAVPSNNDAPSYVQDVFKQFDTRYEHRASRVYVEKHENKESESTQLQLKSVENILTEDSVIEQEEEEEESIKEENDPKEPIKSIEIKEAESIPFNPSKYLSRFIDHTVLKPKSSEDDIRKMCDEAIKYDFFSVCCNPCWVSLCQQLLKDSNVKICCVVGFPLGSNTTQIKVLEAQQAVKDGADVKLLLFSINF